jgi:hypothetical protein
MTFDGLHMEFHTLTMNNGWHSPEGYPSGIQQKILAGKLNEADETGRRTRLLRFDPGVFTTKPFVHRYWEEVFLITGDLVVGVDASGEGGEKFTGYTYAIRPPGVFHGPFRSDTGCLLLELHYFA